MPRSSSNALCRVDAYTAFEPDEYFTVNRLPSSPVTLFRLKTALRPGWMNNCAGVIVIGVEPSSNVKISVTIETAVPGFRKTSSSVDGFDIELDRLPSASAPRVFASPGIASDWNPSSGALMK